MVKALLVLQAFKLNSKNRYRIGFLALTSMMFITGCSSVQLAYRTSPSLIQYQLDSYLDLTDAQEVTLKE